MPTTTSTQAAGRSAKYIGGVKIPTGQEIYDGLMRKIEPELLTKNLKTLDAPYKKETEAARTARYKRYSKAFTGYKKAFKAWSATFKRAVNAYKRSSVKAAEQAAKSEEETMMSNLESQMLAA